MPGQEHPIRGAHAKARAIVGPVQTRDLLHGHRVAYLHAATRAVSQQHVNDPLTGIVTEELPQMLFVKPDARFTHTGNEALGRMGLECMAHEARIAAQVAGRIRAIQIGEVAVHGPAPPPVGRAAPAARRNTARQRPRPPRSHPVVPLSCPHVLRHAACTAYGRGARQRIILPTRFGRSRHTREPPCPASPASLPLRLTQHGFRC